MNNNRKLIIRYTRTNEPGTEKKVSIPLPAFRTAEKLLPRKLRELIAENNIDISVFSDMNVEGVTSEALIKVETTGGSLELSIE